MDNVNHPKHYIQGGIETIDVIQSRLTKEEFVGYLKGTKMKYDLRYPFKGDIEGDLAKSEWFRHKLIQTLRHEDTIIAPELEAQLQRVDDE